MRLKYGPGRTGRTQRREPQVAKFKRRLEAACEKAGVRVTHVSCILNADQTGIFYSQVPSGTNPVTRRSLPIIRARRMKDKGRITLMLCAAAGGTNFKCPA